MAFVRFSAKCGVRTKRPKPFDLNEYITSHHSLREIKDKTGELVYSFPEIIPHIECNDGWMVSVQADEFKYCEPRNNVGPYTTVELGYPNAPDPDLADYIECSSDDPMSAVYLRVPVRLVEQIIAKHGGFKGEADKTVRETFIQERVALLRKKYGLTETTNKET